MTDSPRGAAEKAQTTPRPPADPARLPGQARQDGRHDAAGATPADPTARTVPTQHGPGAPDGTAAPLHAERLHVSWYSWLLPMAAAGLMAATVHLGYPGLRSWLPYVVLLPLTALLIWRAGRAPVRISDGELYVGEAHLPLEHVGEVETFAAKDKRKVLGPHLDPSAFVLHRSWVGPVVRVRVTDPADPTPYWVFSTRHPEKVASLLHG